MHGEVTRKKYPNDCGISSDVLMVYLARYLSVFTIVPSFPPTIPSPPFSLLRQIQDETLRLSTLAPWAARYSDKDIMIEGHVIPAGTPIIQALGVGLKNQTTWENPDT